ncbi:MAG: ATP-binding protein [Methanoculleus marisnigri]|uniref:ATP-binding protein n=1 Tax=Methanoculleus marisnigri TaxID=2198 RepID=A0A117LRP8_9EURY|nr:MAG: ATP-binding protein [Methanoculleus marisnigri]KUL05597.1 MAG: ATP-binding protein [Methanoculleus marisnigri]
MVETDNTTKNAETGSNNAPDTGQQQKNPFEKVAVSVKHVILVLSGKGGVGKTTVAANLAMALANHGYQTGLLDLDIHGPNIPKMMGIEETKLTSTNGTTIEPVYVVPSLGVVSMAFLLPDSLEKRLSDVESKINDLYSRLMGKESQKSDKIEIGSAAKGIRTPVVGVKGRHDWPLHYSSMHNVPYNFDARG